MPKPFFQNPRFDALRNAIYHTSRGRFLEALSRFFNFLVIVLGAAAVAKITAESKLADSWIELGVVIIATIQLVFDFGGRSAAHLYLQKRYYELLAEMETADISNEEEENRGWSAKLLTIAADEPMPMRALDAIAYNTALDSLIEDPEQLAAHRLHVSWWQRRLRHIWAFSGHQFGPASRRIGFWSKVCRCFPRSTPMEKVDG